MRQHPTASTRASNRIIRWTVAEPLVEPGQRSLRRHQRHDDGNDLEEVAEHHASGGDEYDHLEDHELADEEDAQAHR